ncbi:MAG: efflux RND transporter periplasmic adaptor subunit [Phycisphaeraceae bacterium]
MKRFIKVVIVLALAMGFVAAEPARSVAGGSQTTPGEKYRGLVIPSKQVVLTAPLDGILAKIHVDTGSAVKQGDAVAAMDAEIQQYIVDAAKLRADSTAAVTVARLTLEEAKLEVEKMEDIVKRGGGSDWELRQRKVVSKQREAELEAEKERTMLAAAELKLEEAKLRKHAILAPFDGTVIDVVVEEGASLARNDKAIVLAALDVLEARISLPNRREFYESMRGRIGEKFRMMAGDPVNKEITGILKSVRPVIDPGSATFLCEFTIDNKVTKMPAGFAVDLVWPQ